MGELSDVNKKSHFLFPPIMRLRNHYISSLKYQTSYQRKSKPHTNHSLITNMLKSAS